MEFKQLQKIFKAHLPLLILGESGSGKSYLARQIHDEVVGRESPFISINIATLSESLLESELFGHKKGSFTGAIADKPGLLDQCASGTLFIDEIGDLSLPLQKKLLELVDEGTYTAVGDLHKRHFRGRLITATHRHLEEMSLDGSFRRDLYFRLRGGVTTLPSLKERGMMSFRELALEFGLSALKIETGLLEEMFLYPWPGNIRELKYAVRWLMACQHEGEVSKNDFGLWMTMVTKNEDQLAQTSNLTEIADYHEALDSFERELLLSGLKRNHGKINQTSRNMKISKVTLLAKIRKYGIKVQHQQWAA